MNLAHCQECPWLFGFPRSTPVPNVYEVTNLSSFPTQLTSEGSSLLWEAVIPVSTCSTFRQTASSGLWLTRLGEGEVTYTCWEGGCEEQQNGANKVWKDTRMNCRKWDGATSGAETAGASQRPPGCLGHPKQSGHPSRSSFLDVWPPPSCVRAGENKQRHAVTNTSGACMDSFHPEI